MAKDKNEKNRTTDDHGHPERGEDPRKIRCGVCQGSGSLGDKVCWNCSGEGEI